MTIHTLHRDTSQDIPTPTLEGGPRPSAQLLAFQRMKHAVRSAFFAHHQDEPDFSAGLAALIKVASDQGEASFDGKCLNHAIEVTSVYARDQAAHIRDWWAHQQTGGGAP